MRKGGLLLLAGLMAAGMVTTADAQSRRAAPARAPEPSAQERSMMFIAAAMTPWETQWQSATPAKPAATKRSAKKRSKSKRA